MQFKDYYRILGVDAGADDAQIKTAYRRLARKYHPDVSREAGAEERFKEVNEAYEALRDPQRRQAYDALRARGYRPGDEVQPGGGAWGGADGFADHEDLFRSAGAGGNFSDFFEHLFRGGGGFRGPGAQRGPAAGSRNRDTRARLAVPLETVYRGEQARISVAGKSLQVRVPAGIRPGQSIRLKGQGSAGGDLLLQIEYAAHPQFEVDGGNVIHVLSLAPWEAALGCSISVPTLGGPVQLKIPPSSEAGRKLRLRGRGMPGAGTNGAAGDQIVELEVLAPAPQSDTQRQAYERLRDAFGEDWRDL